MNTARLLRRLRKERLEWVHSGHGPEIFWNTRGIDTAIRIVREIENETRIDQRDTNFLAPPRLAGALALAIKRSVNYLERGQKPRAVKALRKALALVEG